MCTRFKKVQNHWCKKQKKRKLIFKQIIKRYTSTVLQTLASVEEYWYPRSRWGRLRSPMRPRSSNQSGYRHPSSCDDASCGLSSVKNLTIIKCRVIHLLSIQYVYLNSVYYLCALYILLSRFSI